MLVVFTHERSMSWTFKKSLASPKQPWINIETREEESWCFGLHPLIYLFIYFCHFFPWWLSCVHQAVNQFHFVKSHLPSYLVRMSHRHTRLCACTHMNAHFIIQLIIPAKQHPDGRRCLSCVQCTHTGLFSSKLICVHATLHTCYRKERWNTLVYIVTWIRESIHLSNQIQARQCRVCFPLPLLTTHHSKYTAGK